MERQYEALLSNLFSNSKLFEVSKLTTTQSVEFMATTLGVVFTQVEFRNFNFERHRPQIKFSNVIVRAAFLLGIVCWFVFKEFSSVYFLLLLIFFKMKTSVRQEDTTVSITA